MKKPAAEKSRATISGTVGFMVTTGHAVFWIRKNIQRFFKKKHVATTYLYFERLVFVSQKFEKWPSEM
jgi:hypothetical protein